MISLDKEKCKAKKSKDAQFLRKKSHRPKNLISIISLAFKSKSPVINQQRRPMNIINEGDARKSPKQT